VIDADAEQQKTVAVLPSVELEENPTSGSLLSSVMTTWKRTGAVSLRKGSPDTKAQRNLAKDITRVPTLALTSKRH
jgi:hypothetical protein